MLMMTRLRLINWHNFVNDCLDIKKITYFIGVSGVGKTTIMDAIRYCLTTYKDFNSVGNKNSKRTLLGSVHGKQHTSGKFTRTGHTVTYIGCEFCDTDNDSYFVIVSRVESESPDRELRHASQDWYYTAPNVRLEDIPFLNKNTPTDKKSFKMSENRLHLCQTQTEAKQKICRLLGVGNLGSNDSKSENAKRFLDVFHMGTSLDGISDVRDFIYAYILPSPGIDAEELDKDRQKLEEMQEILQISLMKKELLEKIMNGFEAAESKQHEIDMNKGYILYAEKMDIEYNLTECSRKIDEAKSKLLSLNSARVSAKMQEKAAQAALNDAEKTFNESTETKELAYLTERKNTLTNELNTAVKNSKSFDSKLSELNILRSELLQVGMNIDKSPLEHTDEESVYIKEKMFLSEMKDNLEEALIDIRTQKQQTEKRLNELSNIIVQLKKGNLIYPDNDQARKVKELINTRLSEAGLEPDAKILCELLQVNDESWQDAAEISLNRRRFDILVSPQHYHFAKKALSSKRKVSNGISLVDTVTLMKDEQHIHSPEADELASKIDTENRMARLYINSLLANIHCCENEDDIENYKKSITKNCIRHMYYRTEFVKPVEQFIGIGARQKQLKNAKKEQDELRPIYARSEKRSKLLKGVIDHYHAVLNNDTFDHLIKFCGEKMRSKELENELECVKNTIDEMNSNPLFKDMFDQKQECLDNLNRVKEKIRKIDEEIGGNKTTIENEEKNKTVLEKKYEDSEKSCDEYFQSYPQFISGIQNKFNDSITKKSAENIAVSQKNYHNQLKNGLEKIIINQLEPYQREYNQTYSTDHIIGIDSYESFSRLYHSLINIELERNIEEVRNAKERCKERFRNDVLFRLKNDILDAKKQFRRLNRIIEQFDYGEEYYHFDIDGTSDPELSIFYDAIMKDNNSEDIEQLSFDTINGYEEFDVQINELMNKIMADIEAASSQRAEGKAAKSDVWSKYIDYRTYLDYDIRITNRITGDFAYLSQVNGEGSGGETQAPFYVAICASMLQIYNQSPNGIRLVLLDEAFSKMTSDRIRPMIGMIKEMGLQTLLISTAEKCTEVEPFCDSVYSVIRVGAKNTIKQFNKDGETSYGL